MPPALHISCQPTMSHDNHDPTNGRDRYNVIYGEAVRNAQVWCIERNNSRDWLTYTPLSLELSVYSTSPSRVSPTPPRTLNCDSSHSYWHPLLQWIKARPSAGVARAGGITTSSPSHLGLKRRYKFYSTTELSIVSPPNSTTLRLPG